MKNGFVVLAALAAIGCSTAAALAENRAGAVNLTPVIGGYHYDGGQLQNGIEPNILYGLKAGYNVTDRFGIEGLLHFVHTHEWLTRKNQGRSDKMDMFNYRLELLYHLFPKSSVVPFLAVGGGVIHTDFDNDEDDDSAVLSYGLGAKFALTDNVALRTDVRMMSVWWEPEVVYNYEYTLGLNFQFGGTQPVAAPAPKVAAPPPAPTSSLTVSPASVVKGNPATLKWTSSNTSVCSITPGIGGVQAAGSMTVTPDGSTEYALSCAGEGGSTVSKTRLAVAPAAPVDSDMDGVTDNLDKCPGTPQGVKVDANGCPLDADKDGVADYLDKCPGTPLGVKVDTDGCPLDSDRDGVADYLDKCPETPLFTKVNKDGCPFAVCKVITLDLEFDFNKADIKSKDYDKLKTVAESMKSFDTATVLIEGHTDSKGTDAYNLKLSQRRADAVRKFLIDKYGIAAERLTAKGFGEKKPVASNATEEGRAKNRRVDTIFTCH